MRRILCILALAAIVLISTVAAAPVLPAEFYGSVYLNDNPAPAGTVIVGKINGEQRGEITTTTAGAYGGPGNYEPRLMVSPTEEEVNAGNARVTFFVGGVQASQIVPFKSGNSEKLDLLANSKAFDTSVAMVTTTKKAGAGPLSVVFLAVSIIAVLCILGLTDYTRKRR